VPPATRWLAQNLSLFEIQMPHSSISCRPLPGDLLKTFPCLKFKCLTLPSRAARYQVACSNLSRLGDFRLVRLEIRNHILPKRPQSVLVSKLAPIVPETTLEITLLVGNHQP
jgi:hypothetical protein